MSVKYVFVTGGVVSGLGKGITAASLGRLLKERGYHVTVQKFDPYINVDSGLISPYQHGEVFVTDDGGETDLDLGHYERFVDETLYDDSHATTGKVYWNVLNKERNGEYLGNTVQVIPHITNEIKDQIKRVGKNKKMDIVIVEVGGTVGDIEGLPILEAIRQMAVEVGRENVLFVHVTLVPFIAASNELKSKPTQHSVKELRSLGIQPQIIVCRSEINIPQDIKEKISIFCDVNVDSIITNKTAQTLYEVPLMLENEGLADIACKHLGIDNNKPTLKEWKNLVSSIKSLEKTTNIAVVGKYVEMPDAYLSAAEALRHGGFFNNSHVNITLLDSTSLTEENVFSKLSSFDGIVVPSGFGHRGTEGKILASKYARENNVPFLGVGYGMQMATIDIARNLLNIKNAASEEFCEDHPEKLKDITPVVKKIDFSKDDDFNHKSDLINSNLSFTNIMRLGSYPCKIEKGTSLFNIYNKETINERHRNKYEINTEYKKKFEDVGVVFSSISENEKYIEAFEIKDHPFYIAVLYSPEFLSRPNKPHPIFSSFIKASLENK